MAERFDEHEIIEAAAAVRQLIHRSQSMVAFTGAGISTESGIPDFRSPGGVWATNQPVFFDDFLNNPRARHEYWRQKAAAHPDFAAAVPNVAHKTLAAWESAGVLRGVITQNIDGLHQAAGSRSVLELHGTARNVSCLDCTWQDTADRWVALFLQDNRVPDCPSCGGLLKHATVSFGQVLPEDILAKALDWTHESDVFLALGSSLVVHPAATLPRLAREHGAALVIINRDPTPLDDVADIVIQASLGRFFHAYSSNSGDPS